MPSSQLLRDIFNNKEASRRIGKWAIELSQFEFNYVSRTTIKSQALADFIADWTPAASDTTLQFEEPLWTVHCDGAWGRQVLGLQSF